MSGDWWHDLSFHFKSTRGFPLPTAMRDQAKRELLKIGSGSLSDAVNRVKTSSDASQGLVDALGIGLTWFNREYQGISALVASHSHLRQATGRNTTWLWSVGCSMGQEPYSIAIALLEAGAHPIILATDFNREHLHIAQRGRYAPEKLRLVPSEVRSRYFQKTRDGHYEVTPDLRRCVSFELHNFAINDRQPDGWEHLDGVICRNALIYYDSDEGTRIARNLCSSLRPGGYFLVGSVDRPVLRRLQLADVSGVGLARVPDPTRFAQPAKGEASLGSLWAPVSNRAHGSSLDVPSPSSQASPAPRTPVPSQNARPQGARATEPDDGVEDLMRAADALSRSRQEKACIELLQAGVRRFPLAAAIHVMLGISLKRAGDIPGAIVELRAARFLDSGGWLAAYYLASCLALCEQDREAQRMFRDTLRIIESGQPACCTEIPGTGDLATLAATTAESCRSRISTGT